MKKIDMYLEGTQNNEFNNNRKNAKNIESNDIIQIIA